MIATPVPAKQIHPFQLLRQFLKHWRPFLAIHLAVTLLTGSVLLPMTAALLRLAVSLSGEPALSDQDILFFVLSPGGFLAFVLLGSLFSIIVFLGHAAMLVVAVTVPGGKPATARQALLFLARRFAGLFELALRILLRVLLNLLPFALAAWLLYRLLLTEFDINYYLSTKPREWLLAIAGGGLLVAACAANLLRLFANWLLCLPLLLFSGCAPREALTQSRATLRGHRTAILGWLVAWLLAGTVLATAATGAVALAGNFVIPLAADTVDALLLALGLFSFLGFLLSFGVSLAASTWLSLFIVRVCNALGLQWTHRPADSAPDRARPLLANRRLVVLGLAGGFCVAVLLAWLLVQRLPFATDTRVMAHRGASGSAPENTLAAIRGAIDSGADWVEIDVQETADGRIAVIHDSDLKKIGGSPLTVAGATLAQLQQVDIGSWFHPRFADQRVPSLEEVLALCRDRIGVNIELKYYGREKQLEQRVVDIVEAAGMTGQVMFMSLSYAGIQALRRLRPGWKVGLLSSVAVGKLTGLDVDFLALNGRAASRTLIRQAHAHGKQVLVWTVNDPVAMASMIGRGVDGLITDEPSRAVAVLQQYRELEPAERLLIQLADAFDRPSLYREQ
ncbi:MAG: glycerophosphodiester phosphodiesterase family protein [Xanthomonadales bacterium]|nr:glycerophosphodiester phosphodiesterase family protein [Xanthomonadales bacterium]